MRCIRLGVGSQQVVRLQGRRLGLGQHILPGLGQRSQRVVELVGCMEERRTVVGQVRFHIGQLKREKEECKETNKLNFSKQLFLNWPGQLLFLKRNKLLF